jgi:hypothetical protein
MDTTEYQRALLSFYTSHIELAAAPMLHEPPLFVHATVADSSRELGTSVTHEHQFIGIYESDAEDLSGLVAATRHFDATTARLDHGHTCPLDENDDSALRRRGYGSGSMSSSNRNFIDVSGSTRA